MCSMKRDKVFPTAAAPAVARTAALAAALAAALSACGGGGGDASPAPVISADPPATPAPTPTPTPTPTPPVTPQPQPTPPVDPAPPRDITLAPAYTAIAQTVTFSTPNWPAWSHTGTAAVDGVGCAHDESYHVHALVSIYHDGKRLALPDSVGRGSGCSYEMHTHDGSGVVHIETDAPKTFTLGQFFALWGQPVSATAVAGLSGTPTYYVIDGEKVARVATNPAELALSPHREIVIVTGTAPAEVPRYDWNTSGL
jgi:hypothetical protein